MADVFSISNIKELAEDVRNNSFEGFTVSNPDPRDVGEDLADGSLPVDLYGTGLEANSGLGDKISETIEGQDIGVFAEGRKLFETSITGSKLRIGGSNETINIDSSGLDRHEASTLKNLNPDLSIPEIDSGTFADLFQALDVRKLTFKPVQDRVPNNFEGSLPGPDKVKEKTSNMSLGLILPVVAVLGLVYLVVFR